jgi:uncharacterized membrane protein YciS (DUF1049 family)
MKNKNYEDQLKDEEKSLYFNVGLICGALLTGVFILLLRYFFPLP